MTPAFRQAVAERLLLIATWLMPAGQKQWGYAMAAELRYIPVGGGEVAFATGCLWFALVRRCVGALRGAGTELAVGAATGVVFVTHAFIPNSQSWPWIWPALGGVVISVARCRSDQLGWGIVASGLKAGLACASVFLAGGVAVMAVAAFHFDAPVVWRGLGLVVYGAFGALVLAPTSAAAATAVADRLR